MCSITGFGERQDKVLGQMVLKLWLPWQPNVPIDLQWEKCCDGPNPFIFDWIFFNIAGNEDRHKISDEFSFGLDRTICFWSY